LYWVKLREPFVNRCKRINICHSAVFDKSFWKIEREFEFKDFLWAVEKAKELWKERPKESKLYHRFARYAHKHWIMTSSIFDFIEFWIDWFNFQNKEEAVKEIKSTWKEWPAKWELYSKFNWRAWYLWIDFSKLLDEVFDTSKELTFSNEEELKEVIKNKFNTRPQYWDFINKNKVQAKMKKLDKLLNLEEY
jgi:hypothetical protein